MTIKLGTINQALRLLCLTLYVGLWDGQGERSPTTFTLAFIGFPGTARRKAWDARWFVQPTAETDPSAVSGGVP